MSDIVKRLREQAFDATNWHGETMKQWDKIRALCAERDGSDLPRLMFEGLVESLAALMIEGADEIDKFRVAAEDVCGWDTADDHPDFSRDIEALRKLLPPEFPLPPADQAANEKTGASQS